jgi:hypothetical protein
MLKYSIVELDITSQKEVQNSTIGGKIDVDTFLGCTRANFGTQPREEHDSKQHPL